MTGTVEGAGQSNHSYAIDLGDVIAALWVALSLVSIGRIIEKTSSLAAEIPGFFDLVKGLSEVGSIKLTSWTSNSIGVMIFDILHWKAKIACLL